MASAIESAPSQFLAALNGDQPTVTTPFGGSIDALGSKSIVHPPLRLAAAVDARTSGLVDVLTTAPAAERTFGITNDDVLPDREGPRTSPDRSAPLHAHPPGPLPR
jgi:hypothetical protein